MKEKPPTDRWSWLRVEIEGGDLVVRGARATNFGHAGDDADNGVGSGGWRVRAHPDVPVVALPYRVPGHAQFDDSPLPPLKVKTPYSPGTRVRVYCPATGRTAEAELADLGPSLYITKKGKKRSLKTAVDLSEATVRALGLTLAQGEYTVDFRVLGGALAASTRRI